MPRKTLEDKLYFDNWPRRRRWMLVTLLWFIANAQYLIIWGNDTGLHQNAMVTCLGAIVAIIGSYVFGAVWDDVDKRKRMADAPRGEALEPKPGDE